MTDAPAVHYEPFDPAFTRRLAEEVYGPAIERWFRSEIHGAEKLPDTGPLVIVSNHSGNGFPHDGMNLDALLWKRDGHTYEAKLRALFEKELSFTWWMRPFGVNNFWRKGGGIDATYDNFDRALARGDRTLYYPEGVPGIGKGFDNRYQLQRFSGTFVRLAAKHDAPVIPIHCINAEWSAPFGYTWDWLDRLVQKVGVPFWPLPIGLLGLVPVLWYFSFPCKLVFVVGEPFDVRTMLREVGETRWDGLGNEAVRAVADRIHDEMQEQLTNAVADYGGDKPYRWRDLGRALRGPDAWKAIPLSWPFYFTRYERDLNRPAAPNRLVRWLRDWDVLAWFVPILGWPLVALLKRLRRPPYGYRGMTELDAKLAQGEFKWRLDTLALPPRASLTAVPPVAVTREDAALHYVRSSPLAPPASPAKRVGTWALPVTLGALAAVAGWWSGRR